MYDARPTDWAPYQWLRIHGGTPNYLVVKGFLMRQLATACEGLRQARWGRSLAAEVGEQSGWGVGGLGHGQRRADDAGLARLVGEAGEPGSADVDQLGVQRLVLADGMCQIPSVDDQVGDELGDVFVPGDVAEGQVDDLICGAFGVNGGCGSGGRVVPCGLRVRAERVAVQAAADVGHGSALEERRDPEVFGDDVSDERVHVPLRARGRQCPLVGPDRVNEVPEPAGCASVQLRDGGTHRGSPTRTPSRKAHASSALIEGPTTRESWSMRACARRSRPGPPVAGGRAGRPAGVPTAWTRSRYDASSCTSSMRAEPPRTRKVWGVPLGTDTQLPGSARKSSSPRRTTIRPSST